MGQKGWYKMGYESKMIIVEKYDSTRAFNVLNKKIGEHEDKDFKYGSIITTFDLCKCPAISKAFEDCKDTDCYIIDENKKYADSITDCYDNYMKEMSIESLISVIENSEDKSITEYRRIPPFLGLLKGFNACSDKWRNLVVLHYGH